MTLNELIDLLVKRARLVIAIVVVAFVAAYVYVRFLPDQYTTSTTIYILTTEKGANTSTTQSNQDGSAVTASDLNMGSAIGSDVTTIINSKRVKRDVAERLGLSSLGGYSFSLDNSSSTRVVTLSVTGTDPEMVAAIANTTVEVTSDVAVEILKIESINPIDVAEVPTSPSGPNRTLYVMVGVLAGLFVAVSIVVLLDVYDTRVRNGEDCEAITGLPTLGCFPLFDNNKLGITNAAKTLLANVRFMSVDSPIKTIVVTSAVPNEGKTFVAANFAAAVATSGKTVLLVDCDMRRRSLASQLDVHPKQGIYAVMSGEANLKDAVAPTRTPNLYFLDCEPQIPSPSDLMNTNRFSELIDMADKMFDYVVFDTPPLGAFVDAAVLGNKADSVLLVVREKFAPRTEVASAVEQLRKSGCSIAGTVMNCCEASGSGSYYDHYSNDRGRRRKRKRRSSFRARQEHEQGRQERMLEALNEVESASMPVPAAPPKRSAPAEEGEPADVDALERPVAKHSSR